jgi:uncharacterized protein involved in exopolysaccharide biosynthesis
MPGHNGSNGSHSQANTAETSYAVAGISSAMNVSSSQILASISRHRGMLAVLGIVMVAAAIGLGAVWPRTYRSEAKLYVRLGRENMGLDATASMGKEISGIQVSREEELNTVAELLRSRAVLERVVDTVGPDTVLNPSGAAPHHPSLLGFVGLVAHWISNDATLPEREKAVNVLRKQLDIQNIRKTDMILIAHEGPDPKASQSIVSNLMNLYLDEHLRMSRPAHAHAFLSEQASAIKTQLIQRETELKNLKDQTGLASPAEQRQTLVLQIGRLEDDLKNTLAAIGASEAGNREITAEQGRAAAVDSKAHEELRLMLIKEKPALAANRAKADLVRKQLADAKEQLRNLNGHETRITQLQREAQILDVSYRKYSEGLEQARLDESLESQRISNLTVAQPASMSLQPVKPQRSLFLMGGLLLAVFGGPTLAVLFDSRRTKTASLPVEYWLDAPTAESASSLGDPRPIGV